MKNYINEKLEAAIDNFMGACIKFGVTGKNPELTDKCREELIVEINKLCQKTVEDVICPPDPFA